MASESKARHYVVPITQQGQVVMVMKSARSRDFPSLPCFIGGGEIAKDRLQTLRQECEAESHYKIQFDKMERGGTLSARVALRGEGTSNLNFYILETKKSAGDFIEAKASPPSSLSGRKAAALAETTGEILLFNVAPLADPSVPVTPADIKREMERQFPAIERNPYADNHIDDTYQNSGIWQALGAAITEVRANPTRYRFVTPVSSGSSAPPRPSSSTSSTPGGSISSAPSRPRPSTSSMLGGSMPSAPPQPRPLTSSMLGGSMPSALSRSRPSISSTPGGPTPSAPPRARSSTSSTPTATESTLTALSRDIGERIAQAEREAQERQRAQALSRSPMPSTPTAPPGWATSSSTSALTTTPTPSSRPPGLDAILALAKAKANAINKHLLSSTSSTSSTSSPSGTPSASGGSEPAIDNKKRKRPDLVGEEAGDKKSATEKATQEKSATSSPGTTSSTTVSTADSSEGSAIGGSGTSVSDDVSASEPSTSVTYGVQAWSGGGGSGHPVDDLEEGDVNDNTDGVNSNTH
jgi:hypothetical protein